MRRSARYPAGFRHSLVGHEADGVRGIDAVKNRDVVVDFHVGQFGADLLEFVSDAADFGIRAIRFEVVAQHAFPVSLLAGMNRVPMPILDHVGPARYVRVNVEAQLPVVGRKLAGGIPAERLRVRFSDEKVAVLERARKISLQRLPRAIHVILRRRDRDCWRQCREQRRQWAHPFRRPSFRRNRG